MANASERAWTRRVLATLCCYCLCMFAVNLSRAQTLFQTSVNERLLLAEPQQKIPVDELGDALPERARFRIGTQRFIHPGAVTELTLAADEQSLVTFGSGSIVCWDTATGKRRWSDDLELISDTVYGTRGLAIASQCASAYVSSQPNELLKWDVRSGAVTHLTVSHSLPLSAENRPASALPGLNRSIDVSADGSRMAVAGGHGVVVYDGSGKSLFELPNSPKTAFGPTDWAIDPLLFGGHYSFAKLSPDGEKMAVILSQFPQSVQLLETTTGKALQKFELESRAVRVAFAPNGKSLVTTERGCAVSHYSTETGLRTWQNRIENFENSEASKSYTSAIVIDSDDKRLAVVAVQGNRQAIYILAVSDGSLIARLASPNSTPRALAFTADSKLLYSAGADGFIRRWDLQTFEQLAPPQGFHHSGLLVTAPLTTKFAHVDQLGNVYVSDIAAMDLDKPLRRRFEISQAVYSKLALSRDARLLAAGGEVGDELFVAIWEVANNTLLRLWKFPKLATSPHGIDSLEFSPDGSRVAAAAVGGQTALLWNTSNGQQLAEVKHELLTCVTFDRTGERLATGGADDRLRIWDSSSGKLLLMKEMSVGGLQNVRYSPVDDLLVTAQPTGMLQTTGMLRIWNSNDLILMQRGALGARVNFKALEFSSSGNWLVSGSTNQISILNARSGDIVWRTGPVPNEGMISVGFLDHDQVLVSGTSDGVGYGWDLRPRGDIDFDKLWSELREGGQSDPKALLWQLEQIGDPAVDEIQRRLQPVETIINLRAISKGLDAQAAEQRIRLALQLCDKDPQFELDSRVKYALGFLKTIRSAKSLALLKRLATDHPALVIRKEAMFALEEIE